MAQLFADCLDEIFEYLEEDKVTLYSCLLVNRLWCEVSVRILWRNVQNYRTLIVCLPNESKEILYKNKIICSNLTSNPPLFNYVEFIKNISIYNIDIIIKNILQNYQSVTPQSLKYKKYLIAKELYKLLMNQIPSLKSLHFYSNDKINIPNINFISNPGAKVCLKDLTELSCRSDFYPGFFYQLAQICNNIQTLKIRFEEIISDGLTDLISVQKNLKYLDMKQSYDGIDFTDTFSLLTNLPDTLIKLDIYGVYGGKRYIPLSFIAKFTKLRELVLSFYYYYGFENFKELQYDTFPQLQVLNFKRACPGTELLIKFLENNGKGLKEFYADKYDISLNLAIAKFCPNLRKLFTSFNESETLKTIFNSCQYLESIETRCGYYYLSEKEILDVVASYSLGNFHELKMSYIPFAQSVILPEDLELFFINWKNRVPQKSLSFIINIKGFCLNSLESKKENMEVIEKYKELGVIKTSFNIQSL